MSDDDTTSAGPRLLGPAEVRSLAGGSDLRPTKQRGQNFVIDPNTVRRIVRRRRGRRRRRRRGGRARARVADPRAARRGRRVRRGRGRPGARAALPATVAERAPGHAERFDVVEADALRVAELPGPPPTALVANLPYNVVRAGAAAPARPAAVAAARAGHGAGRGRRPARRAARVADLRRPVGQGGLVRRGPRGPARSAARSSGPPRTSTPAWSPGSAATRRRHAASAPRSSPSSTPRSPSAARPCARRSPAGRPARWPTRRWRRRRRPAGPRRAAGRRRLRPDRRGARDDARCRRVPVARRRWRRRDRRGPRPRPRPRSTSTSASARSRDDGYHPLATVYQAVGAVRRGHGAPAADADASRRPASGVDVTDVPADGTNLALRAVAAAGRAPPASTTRVADARPQAASRSPAGWPAAAPTPRPRWWRCDALFGLRHRRARSCSQLAAELGSDVPFCLSAAPRSARARRAGRRR